MKAAFQRLRYAATKRLTRKEWTEQQAMDDISEQILGDNYKPTAAQRVRQEQPMSVAQQALLDALTQEMRTTLEGQLHRRTKAIVGYRSPCGLSFTRSRRHVRQNQHNQYHGQGRPSPVRLLLHVSVSQ